MLLKTRRRAIIVLVSILLLLLYITRSFSILIPFSISLIALLLFSYIDKSYKFNFPERYYIYIFLMFLLGSIIGPGNPPFGLYYRGVFYDKFLHTINPIMASAILFFIINRLEITLKWKLLMTVTIVFGILSVWEIGEYLLDNIFGSFHQGVYLKDFLTQNGFSEVSGALTDTMRDLIFGLIGSIIYALYIMVIYYKNKVSKK